jgi:hypothetical protein
MSRRQAAKKMSNAMEKMMRSKARKLTTLVAAATLGTVLAGAALAQDVGVSVGATANAGATGVTGVTGVLSGLLGDITGILGGLGLGGIL